MKERRSLEEVLQSTSDVIYPEQLGERAVAIDSKDECGDTPLHVMAWRSDRHAIKLLVEAGADVNAIGDMSETPLHIAVRKGDLGIVETLLSGGARTDIRSEFNQTASEIAEELGGEMHQLLTRYAANDAL